MSLQAGSQEARNIAVTRFSFSLVPKAQAGGKYTYEKGDNLENGFFSHRMDQFFKRKQFLTPPKTLFGKISVGLEVGSNYRG